MKIEDAIQEVQASGARAAKGARVTEIIAAVVTPGAYVRQGDVMLTAIERPATVGEPTERRQLAPGTTQGSRHVVEGDVRVYEPAKTDALLGPTLEVGEAGATVTHPEHRHYRLPAGWWQVTYERDLDQEERARVKD